MKIENLAILDKDEHKQYSFIPQKDEVYFAALSILPNCVSVIESMDESKLVGHRFAVGRRGVSISIKGEEKNFEIK